MVSDTGGVRHRSKRDWRRSDRADAGELFGGRDAAQHLLDAVLPHRPHALFAGRAGDLLAGCLLGGELLEPFAHLEELEDAHAAAVAGLTAARTPSLAVEREAFLLRELTTGHQSLELLRRGLVGLRALRAELAREPLGEHRRHGGAGEERLHTHL